MRKLDEDAIYKVVGRVKGNQQGVVKHPRDRSSGGMICHLDLKEQWKEADIGSWREL